MDAPHGGGWHEPRLCVPRRSRRGRRADRSCRGGSGRHRRGSHGQTYRRARLGCERAAAGRRAPLVSRRWAGRRGTAEDGLHVRAARQAAAERLGAAVVVDRGQARARGRGLRPVRRAVRADRVLARREQRPVRLRGHAGADRGRRLHRRRARAHQQHAGRSTAGLHQRAGGHAAVRMPGRAAGARRSDADGGRVPQPGLLEGQRPGQHVRPRPGPLGGPRPASGVVRACCRRPACGHDGPLARDRHRARRRRRQHPLALRARRGGGGGGSRG